MKVLLLSAYAARSHVHWQQALQSMLPDYQFSVLSLPPRHFSWRVRGNPLYWSRAEREVLEAEYDLLVVTSMVDVATLRGLVPALAALPLVVYFHENQFAYPQSHAKESQLEAQMVSVYAALAADAIWFNSAFNRDSFLDGCEALLGRLPDRVPPGIVDEFRRKSSVIPVPYDLVGSSTGEAGGGWPVKPGELEERYPTPGSPVVNSPLRLVWVGRLEYDKNPRGLLRVIEGLESQGIDFECAVVGQRFRKMPDAFVELESRFSHRLVHLGFIESHDEYLSVLGAADLVLSTAWHEFQGLAVLQAVACGAVPVLPARQAYAELFPAPYRYESIPDDDKAEAESAVARIVALAAERRAGRLRAPDVRAYSAAALSIRYREGFEAVLSMTARR